MDYRMKDLRGYPIRKKLQFIWDYYKLPLVIAAILLTVTVSVVHKYLTAKEPVLYLAAVNVVTGETLTEQLTDGFLDFLNMDPGKTEVVYYSNLFLTDDQSDPNYQYAYGSEIKLMGMIEAKKLDVVFCDKKSYDAFLNNGYLYDMNDFFTDEIPDKVLLTGLVSASPLFQAAGFPEDVYIGVIRNSPRTETAEAFLTYLFK